MISFVHSITCVLVIICVSEAARILAVFPVASISHQVAFRPLTQELARRGHEVIVVTTDPAYPKGQTPPNLTEIDVHDISYTIFRKQFMVSTSKGNKDDLKTQVQILLDVSNLFVEEQLKHKDVQKIINDKNQKIDLLLLEACVKSALIFSHIFKNVPVIQVSSFGAIIGNYESIGAPTHPLLYPMVTQQRINNLTAWEKISEFYNHYTMTKVYEEHDKQTDAMLQRLYGPEVPSVNKLTDNVDMLFLNVHPVFEGIRPVPPSVVFMGGLHQNPEKELPNDLKSYLDASKNGVIYLSFGTNVDPALLPAEKIQTFVKVFSKLPYDVLWKWSKDELPGRTENIRISKWLPQSDLLRHPKIKLFITQGGLQSTDEAITAGVPLIGIPMLGDQWFNVEKYLHHGIGVRLDMEDLTDERLKNDIVTVIHDESYRRNVVRLRGLMLDQPQPPLERAVWWTEHVLRHGGAAHLRAPAANMSWADYLELELVLTLLFAVLTAIIIVLISLYYVYSKFKYNTSSVKIKRN